MPARECTDMPHGNATFLGRGRCARVHPSDEGAGASASGLSRSRTVASLSNESKRALSATGPSTPKDGAGKTTKCDETSSRVVHTKDECLEDVTVITKLVSCYALTVGEVEDCSKEEAASACGRSPACDTLNERLETCAGKD